MRGVYIMASWLLVLGLSAHFSIKIILPQTRGKICLKYCFFLSQSLGGSTWCPG